MISWRERFSPQIAWVAAVSLAALCMCLGVWQLQRAAFKDELSAHFSAIGPSSVLQSIGALMEWQRVRVRGSWLTQHSVLLDNRMRNGRAGYEVLTPLRLENEGGIVIVNRGWLPSNGDRLHPPRIPPLTPHANLGALAVRAVNPGYTLASSIQSGLIWQQADLASFERILGEPVAPWLLRQDGGGDGSSHGDGLDRNWMQPDFGADRHRAYAFQWFAMGAAVLALALWHGLRRKPALVVPHNTSSTTSP